MSLETHQHTNKDGRRVDLPGLVALIRGYRVKKHTVIKPRGGLLLLLLPLLLLRPAGERGGTVQVFEIDERSATRS